MKYLTLKQYPSYVLLALIVALFIVAYNVSKPLIATISISAILSVALYPLYKKFLKFFKKKNIAAFVIIILITLVLLIPSVLLTISLIRESINAYNTVSNLDFSKASEIISNWFGINIDLNKYVKDALVGFTAYLINSARGLLNKIIEVSIHAFLLLFLIFYFLRDGDKIVEGIKTYLPIKKEHTSKLLKDFRDTTNAVIYGIIATGILQWIASSIGFFILGVPNPLLWGLLIFIAALLPVIGASAIWGPAAIYLIVTGNTLNGIILAIYGMVVVSGIETFLKPIIVGSKAKIHSAIILIGFIGGISVWGIAGILMGPIALSLLVVLLRLYKSET